MSWFDKTMIWRVIPDQDRFNSNIDSRPMDDDDWKKYGPRSTVKRPAHFLITQQTLDRLQARRERMMEG